MLRTNLVLRIARKEISENITSLKHNFKTYFGVIIKSNCFNLMFTFQSIYYSAETTVGILFGDFLEIKYTRVFNFYIFLLAIFIVTKFKFE